MGIKLVIADDAPFIREVVKNVVHQHGIEIVGEAANGAEAVEAVERSRPDVVLMDIVMPVKSGIEATIEILENYPETKVIAFSTSDHESVVMQALDAGCCHYLTKPFNSEDLISAIRESVTKESGKKKGAKK